MQNKVSFPVVANTKLRPISEIRMLTRTLFDHILAYKRFVCFLFLASPYNSVFKFGVFNVIQSKCLNDVMYSIFFLKILTNFVLLDFL